MHKSFENEMHKIVLVFETQSEQSIQVKKPNLVLIDKKNLSSRGFCSTNCLQNENKRKRKILTNTWTLPES